MSRIYYSTAGGGGVSRTSLSRTKTARKSLFLPYLSSTEHTRETIKQVYTSSAHCLSPAPDGVVFCSAYLKPASNAFKEFKNSVMGEESSIRKSI